MANAAAALPAPAGRARWTRLVPVVIAAYVISFMDRASCGTFSSLGHDPHISEIQQGLADGIFLIGVPGPDWLRPSRRPWPCCWPAWRC